MTWMASVLERITALETTLAALNADIAYFRKLLYGVLVSVLGNIGVTFAR